MGYLDTGGLSHFWTAIKSALLAKQDKLSGQQNQVVGFDQDGTPQAQMLNFSHLSDGNPVGVIIPFMGGTAPDGYLVCDGAEYPVSDYPALASFFAQQFGAANHFGGDGETTFAVPDMRNLFLRGYHGEAVESLSGEVGERQEGTQFPYVYAGTDDNIAIIKNNKNLEVMPYQFDTTTAKGNRICFTKLGSSVNLSSSTDSNAYTSRPVNMAVLYCIKAVPSSPVLEEYDTDDGWHVRKWSDGYVELSGIFPVTIPPFTNTWGSIYYSTIGGLEFPFSLLKKYSQHISLAKIEGTAFLGTGQGGSLSGTNASLVLSATRANDSRQGSISCHVTGRWK